MQQWKVGLIRGQTPAGAMRSPNMLSNLHMHTSASKQVSKSINVMLINRKNNNLINSWHQYPKYSLLICNALCSVICQDWETSPTEKIVFYFKNDRTQSSISFQKSHCIIDILWRVLGASCQNEFLSSKMHRITTQKEMHIFSARTKLTKPRRMSVMQKPLLQMATANISKQNISGYSSVELTGHT